MVAVFFMKSGLTKPIPLETGATVNKQLRGIRFNDDSEMLTALEQTIDSLTKEDFKNCL